MCKIYKMFIVLTAYLTVISNAVAVNPSDSLVFKQNRRNNIVNVSLVPLIMTKLGYERSLLKWLSIGTDWDYYYKSTGPGHYGLDNGDLAGTYTDISSSYYTIGQANRFDGYLKFTHTETDGACDIEVFFKASSSFFLVKNLQQIFFNSPHNYNPTTNADISVSTFLADSSGNRIYDREVKFNAWGWGAIFGINVCFGSYKKIKLGLEFGGNNAFIPAYAKQPIWVNGQQYYYEYTPAWEDRMNNYLCGYVIFGYRF